MENNEELESLINEAEQGEVNQEEAQAGDSVEGEFIAAEDIDHAREQVIYALAIYEKGIQEFKDERFELGEALYKEGAESCAPLVQKYRGKLISKVAGLVPGADRYKEEIRAGIFAAVLGASTALSLWALKRADKKEEEEKRKQQQEQERQAAAGKPVMNNEE